MIHFLKLMRLDQWLKNLFIFLPAFFSGIIDNLSDFAQLCYTFLAFSLLSSSVYIFNDFFDKEKDKLDPEKKKRPLASGKIKPISAFLGMGLILTLSIILSLIIDPSAKLLMVMAFYLFINIAYTIKLKDIALLDINIIALGFLARILAGGIVVSIIISKWLWITTYLLALLLALGKRRSELKEFISTGIKVRKSISGYSLTFINTELVFVSSVLVVSYIMYTLSPEIVTRLNNQYVYITSFFVILGISRFLQQTLVFNKTGNPTKVLIKDHFLQIVIFMWIIAFAIIIYGSRI